MKNWEAAVCALATTAIFAGLLMLVFGLPARSQLVVCVPAVFFMACLAMKYFSWIKTEGPPRIDEKWQSLNNEGKCGECGCKFTDESPDAGSGMCAQCWSDDRRERR